MRKIELYISYNGKDFYGFDETYGQRTVQSVLENALRNVLGESVRVQALESIIPGCSVRMMPVIFSMESQISGEQLVERCNQNLPNDIRAAAACELPNDYKMIDNCMLRDYEYRFINSPYPVISGNGSLQMIEGKLNLEAMQIAAELLVGENDFSSFTTEPCEDPYLTIFNASVTRDDEIVSVRISGNGFLKHMVQMLTGELIRVGREEMDPNDILQRIRMRTPDEKAPEMLISGLTLNNICPTEFHESIVHNNSEFADYYIMRGQQRIDGTVYVAIVRCEEESFSSVLNHAVTMAYRGGVKTVYAIDGEAERIHSGDKVGIYRPVVMLHMNVSEECLEIPLYGTWYLMKEEKNR